ncbi:hypothetical protein [Amaricoccus solimangrovi]|uniref:Uncharacterized protein n=1 Tax=Amaricoccus solimangrovi TaxID=2589815 RepID=A0A501WG76_9RHOB|nr:hypothetical protein [Amaricoccus solimangrovi]TPE48559.1 hypothetical protein FJM51_17605 [Amaricoccus solimangrovi]
MDEFEIRVVGSEPPRKKGGRLSRIALRAGRLFGRPRALVLSILVGYAVFAGTPHIGWTYECRHPKRMGDPCRYFFSCDYFGVQGRRVIFPKDGETCSLVKIIPIDWAKIL